MQTKAFGGASQGSAEGVCEKGRRKTEAEGQACGGHCTGGNEKERGTKAQERPSRDRDPRKGASQRKMATCMLFFVGSWEESVPS